MPTPETPPAKWPELSWPEVVDRAKKVIFQIVTPSGSGTGFIISRSKPREGGSIGYLLVTAWHVVSELLPDATLHFISADSETVCEALPGSYAIHRLGDDSFDTAVIFVKICESIIAENELLPALSADSILPQGAELGWLGFPGITDGKLCFFSGRISGYLDAPPTYLIDGVAINGVSGGPALDSRAHIIGLVSAYIPNRVDKFTTLPGLMALMPIGAVRHWLEHHLQATVI